ncbi:sigma-70 family RNA polymerase sigma factor [Arthrobacter sp. BL-252-APC-1A]|nr:sigma-70 family RNA polymerase sigma factor [Arthrobacter sp. BL-252-APC-1A]MSS00479.1 sigma-70 family RNA polymerase sigma factor [Arthrobacter sp. BL-252-APC-1A]
MEVKPFEAIVREHGAVVLRVCRAVLGPDDADDAWSDTFLAALRAYPSLDSDANVQAWLVTIAKRKAIDVHRSAVRLPVPVPDLPEPSRTEAPPGEHDGLWAALRMLPQRQREALAYHHLAGMPFAQVAVLLESTETAVRRAAADGMKKLRTLDAEDLR